MGNLNLFGSLNVNANQRLDMFAKYLILVLPSVITVTYAGGLLFWGKTYFNEPTSPPGAGGAASSALSLGAYITVITEGST